MRDLFLLDPDVVFLDSPMAIKATEIYRQATPEFDAETLALLKADANPLAADRFRRCHTAVSYTHLTLPTSDLV